MGKRVWLIPALIAACGDPSGTPDASGFDAPAEAWTWVDVPGMVCGDGSPTGIAINPTTRSAKLVIMVEGGGACWEAANCYGIVVPVTSSHLDGFTAQTFASVRPAYFDSSWMFQRSDTASLFGDATWVFVPYCTGDLHAGTRENVYEALGQQRTMHHKGASNMDAMLARIDDLAVSEVFAMGVSAGGYGIQLNWDRIAAAFPGKTTHAFADGAQLVPVEAGRWGTMNQVWAPRFPAGCATCKDRLDNVAMHWATAPTGGGRYALTSSLQDGVLALFWGYDGAGLRAVSLPIGTAMTGTRAAFMIDNNSHTMLGAPTTRTSTNVELRPWVEGWASGAAAFTTVGP
ncbi:MAG: hypothetical protein H0T42_05175 [Deltaproteobacteria bacterium]|nr:hypothetical protein [Deltaproteobacteria bacterium]